MSKEEKEKTTFLSRPQEILGVITIIGILVAAFLAWPYIQLDVEEVEYSDEELSITTQAWNNAGSAFGISMKPQVCLGSEVETNLTCEGCDVDTCEVTGPGETTEREFKFDVGDDEKTVNLTIYAEYGSGRISLTGEKQKLECSFNEKDYSYSCKNR